MASKERALVSYDLYFTSPKISLEQFNDYFTPRQHYEVNNGQAFYGNDNTGVYFSFEYNDSAPEDEGGVEHDVYFTINYYRPHYFVLEAEPEVKAFIDHFDCSIMDYQSEGMGEGPYSKEGFLRGWNFGNQFGYQAILTGDSAPDVLHSKSTHELEAIWHWNNQKEELENSLREDIFVPRIMFATFDGMLRSFCVWPDAISSLIPSVDYVFVVRDELAPKKWFRKKEGDKCLLTSEEVEVALKQYKTEDHCLNAYKLPAPVTPDSIKQFIKSLQPSNDEISIIGMDSVLNEELIEHARTA